MDNRVFGQIGENTAADVLRCKGYKILKQNYRCPRGEIDIIADRMGEMCFVEVKTRQNFNYGRPAEAINREKILHIRRAAEYYLRELKNKGYVPLRIDFQVMEIVVEHTEHAF